VLFFHKSLIHAILCLSLIFLSFRTVAQERIITGAIQDSTHKALQSASVYLINGDGVISSFTSSNENGTYQLKLKAGQQSSQSWVEVSYIGYSTQKKRISPDQSVYDFTLSRHSQMLQAVTIKQTPPITQSGDTLRYDVDQFARQQDRSIGDVLRRLPGIDIAADGKIFFNGKEITNLYIDGDDLMSGRYGLATKAIQKEMIVSVDVMKNHQPIKVLKNKVETDNTAINLVLRNPNDIKVSVNGMLGAGAPRQYDANINTILLNQHIKALDNISLNNSGISYNNDFKQLGNSNFTANIDDKLPNLNLSLATTAQPDVPLPNYYFNNSEIINLNNLYKTKKDVQFKLNLQGFLDKNRLDYYNSTQIYLPNDTVEYIQRQSSVNRPKLLNTDLNVMVNKEHYFLSNTAKINLSSEQNGAVMNFDQDSFDQKLDRNIKSFSNDFNWMPAIKAKGVLEFRSLINYALSDQLLNVGQGYYSQIPNQVGYYDNVLQQARLSALYSNTYFGYKISNKVINQVYTAGLIAKSQQLNSKLNFDTGAAQIPYSGDDGNDLHWNQNNVYLSAQYQIKSEKIISTINLPLTNQYIHYYQPSYNVDKKNNHLIFNPSLNVKYNITQEKFISGSYRYNTQFTDLSGTYRGGILSNYLNFSNNDAGLQRKNVQDANITYSYQKAISMLFINTGFSYNKVDADAILSTQVSNNIQQNIYLSYKNTQQQVSLFANFSKYLFKLKTTVSLKTQWSSYKYMQLVNNQLQPFNSRTLNVSGRLIKKIYNVADITYEPNATWGTTVVNRLSNSEDRLVNHNFHIAQHLSVNIAPFKKVNIEMTARQSYNSQTNSNAVHYFFMDTKAVYTGAKKKYDVSLTVSNLFNIKKYTMLSIIPNQLIANEYNLRGIMAILRINYYL